MIGGLGLSLAGLKGPKHVKSQVRRGEVGKGGRWDLYVEELFVGVFLYNVTSRSLSPLGRWTYEICASVGDRWYGVSRLAGWRMWFPSVQSLCGRWEVGGEYAGEVGRSVGEGQSGLVALEVNVVVWG